METPPSQAFEFGEFRLDPERRLLQRRDGTPMPLTPRVFETLLYLVQHSGVVLDKEVLMDSIWPDSVVEENNLSQNISNLRRVLGESPGTHRYIVTVPGRGYRFVAEVRTCRVAAAVETGSEPVADESARSSDSPIETVGGHPPARRFFRVLVASGVLLIVLLAAIFMARDRSKSSPSPARTIAVLPFKPLVAESADPILEMGMADTLITKLGGSRAMIVRPLSSVRKYGALDQDPSAAGRELGVGSVLDGSIQKRGDQIRVTARLINVADGSLLWAKTFDEQFTDVFTVQDLISQKVAEALVGRLSGEEMSRLSKRGTENIQAYQLYLTGRYHWNKLIPVEIRISVAFFEQATQLDPKYALAYFGLAEAYRALAITGDVRPKETMPQAKAAATRALEIDDSLAEAHASLVFIHTWYDWDWSGGEREARRAIALNPNSGAAHSAYAQLLSDLGRHMEAIAEAARARELDPVSLIINTIEGSVLYFAGRDEDAAASLKKTLELDPNFWIAHLFLGKVYSDQKRYSEALEQFAKAREFSHGNSETIAMIGYSSALAGDPAKARATLGELESLAGQRYIPPFNIALLHLGLDERDETFAWLEKAYQDRDVRLSFLKVDPKWASLRNDPRFESLMRRLGF